MKIKKILAGFVSLASMGVLSSSTAAAEMGKVETPILFNCNVSFHATGRSAYFLLGYTNIDGSGMMSCYDFAENVVEEIPLKVKVRGPGAGLGITGLNISGGQAGIGLNSSPDALLGEYLVVRGNAAVGVGGAASSGIRIAKGAFYLTVQIEANSGLGAGVDLLSFELKRDRHRPSTRVAMPVPPASAQPMKEAASALAQPVESSLESSELPVAGAPLETSAPTNVRVGMDQTIELVDENGQVVNRYKFQKK